MAHSITHALHIYRETDRENDRQKETQRDRQTTGRQTKRPTERQSERQLDRHTVICVNSSCFNLIKYTYIHIYYIQEVGLQF